MPVPTHVQKLTAEALGTFVLVFAGCGAIIVNAQMHGVVGHLGVCLVFGLVVMAIVYALGHVSGAHVNPAVTIALAAVGKFSWREVPGYVLAQCFGAVAAAGVLALSFGGHDLGQTHPAFSDFQSVLLELVISAILLFVIMAVATDQRAVPGMSGLVVGGTVALLALVAGPISGASMNPARSLGPALVAGDLRAIWIYMVAPTAGAVFGALVYGLLRGFESSVELEA